MLDIKKVVGEFGERAGDYYIDYDVQTAIRSKDKQVFFRISLAQISRYVDWACSARRPKQYSGRPWSLTCAI